MGVCLNSSSRTVVFVATPRGSSMMEAIWRAETVLATLSRAKVPLPRRRTMQRSAANLARARRTVVRETPYWRTRDGSLGKASPAPMSPSASACDRTV